MYATITPLLRQLPCAVALALALIGAAANASPTPSPRDKLPSVAAAALGSATSRCTSAAQRSTLATNDAADGTAAPRDGGAAATLALGGTFCHWVCYPGSGCEYQCRFFPQ